MRAVGVEIHRRNVEAAWRAAFYTPPDVAQRLPRASGGGVGRRRRGHGRQVVGGRRLGGRPSPRTSSARTDSLPIRNMISKAAAAAAAVAASGHWRGVIRWSTGWADSRSSSNGERAPHSPPHRRYRRLGRTRSADRLLRRPGEGGCSAQGRATTRGGRGGRASCLIARRRGGRLGIRTRRRSGRRAAFPWDSTTATPLPVQGGGATRRGAARRTSRRR